MAGHHLRTGLRPYPPVMYARTHLGNVSLALGRVLNNTAVLLEAFEYAFALYVAVLPDDVW